MISAAATTLSQACVRRRSNVSDLPGSFGADGAGHRRLQRHRPRDRGCAGRAGRARRRAAQDSGAAAGHRRDSGRPRQRAGLRAGRPGVAGEAGRDPASGPLGGHLQPGADRAALRARAGRDVPRKRLLGLLPGARAAAGRTAQRDLDRQHRGAARRAGPFPLRGLEGGRAVDDDVAGGRARASGARQPGLAGLGANADGGGIAAPHRAGPLHLGRGAPGGAAGAGEAGVKLSWRELKERATEARERYGRCDLCAHRCLVDRTRGPAGTCREGDGIRLAGAGIHCGEEPQLVPSGVVLIAGCNLACQTCETWQFSIERRHAIAVSAAQLAALLLDLEKRGASNANFVTPTHVLPTLLDALALAAEHGFTLPVVWNCGGYESVEALRLLDGVVDVYLPDAKYGDDAAAYELSGCKGYVGALGESLREMHRQAGTLSVGAGGLATCGVLVRHLVLPDGVAAPEKVMRMVAAISPDMWMNVLSQYRPVHQALRFPIVARTVRADEVGSAVDAALAAGLRNLLVDGCRQTASREPAVASRTPEAC